MSLWFYQFLTSVESVQWYWYCLRGVFCMHIYAAGLGACIIIGQTQLLHKCLPVYSPSRPPEVNHNPHSPTIKFFLQNLSLGSGKTNFCMCCENVFCFCVGLVLTVFWLVCVTLSVSQILCPSSRQMMTSWTSRWILVTCRQILKQ